MSNVVAPRWRARDGWFCILAVFASQFVLVLILGILSFKYPWVINDVTHSAKGAFIATCLGGFVAFGVTLLMARVTSFKGFANAFALDQEPSAIGWGSILPAVALACLGLYFVRRGFVHDTAITRAFRYSDPAQQGLLAVLLLAGPFVEEAIMRGFVYPSFRGTYGVGASTIIVVTIGIFLHPDSLHPIGVYALLIVLLDAGLCYLRERTKNLWDCIICHVAYNATLVLYDHWDFIRSVHA